LQDKKFFGIFLPRGLRTKNSLEFSFPEVSGQKILWNFSSRRSQDKKFFGIFLPEKLLLLTLTGQALLQHRYNAGPVRLRCRDAMPRVFADRVNGKITARCGC
jgi:hypothetical protein